MNVTKFVIVITTDDNVYLETRKVTLSPSHTTEQNEYLIKVALFGYENERLNLSSNLVIEPKLELIQFNMKEIMTDTVINIPDNICEMGYIPTHLDFLGEGYKHTVKLFFVKV